MDDEFWTNFTALMPPDIDVTPGENKCTIKSKDKEISVVRDENNFTINGKTLHFKDEDADIINSFLVPYILQELDGERRI